MCVHLTLKKGGVKMSNSVSNFPPAKLCRELQASQGYTATTIESLMELSNLGKPKDITELKQRFKTYFSFCEEHDFKPAIESLALSLGISRVCFWSWCNGRGVSDEWARCCQQARQCIIAFIESATLSGKVSPPIGIFCLKNLASWRDTISFEDVSSTIINHGQVMKASMLPKLESEEGKNENL